MLLVWPRVGDFLGYWTEGGLIQTTYGDDSVQWSGIIDTVIVELGDVSVGRERMSSPSRCIAIIAKLLSGGKSCVCCSSLRPYVCSAYYFTVTNLNKKWCWRGDL